MPRRKKPGRGSAASAPFRSGWALSCKITTGNGEVGTIRELNNGQITEMMVAKTPFSYTYIQPLNPANLYHGTLAVEPDGAGPQQDHLHLPLRPGTAGRCGRQGQSAPAANRRVSARRWPR